MATIDLTTAPPPPRSLLAGLPRRATLTLPELRVAAEHAGGAPLPFDATAPERHALHDRLGASQGADDDAAYATALGALHDPSESLARRGLLVDGSIDPGIAGALGLLATPEVALEIDVLAGDIRAKSWQRAADGAVATLATADGIVFDLAWFDAPQWPLELARVAVLPEEVTLGRSQVPDLVDVPFELSTSIAEALRADRADLVPVLVAQHSGTSIDGDGRRLPDADVATILQSVVTESQGRLRVLLTQVSAEIAPVGVVSWLLLRDGWRAVRPHRQEGVDRLEIRGVEPADLSAMLAPVLAGVRR